MINLFLGVLIGVTVSILVITWWCKWIRNELNDTKVIQYQVHKCVDNHIHWLMEVEIGKTSSTFVGLTFSAIQARYLALKLEDIAKEAEGV